MLAPQKSITLTVCIWAHENVIKAKGKLWRYYKMKVVLYPFSAYGVVFKQQSYENECQWKGNFISFATLHLEFNSNRILFHSFPSPLKSNLSYTKT